MGYIKDGQRRKSHVDSTFFPVDFDEIAHDSGYRIGTNREKPTIHHLTSSIFLRGR